MVLSKEQLNTATVINILKDAVKESATRQRIMVLADAYAEQGEVNKAIEQDTSLLSFLKSDEELLKSKVIFQMGYLYFTHQQWKEAETMLKKAISCKSVCPAAYNLLAYYYSEYEPKKLGKAMEYIEKALAQETASAVFLDTKGYILYKQGKLDAARELFKAALRITPSDKIVEAHLALMNEK